ncbi:MAG: hypothetical protein JW862_08410 [Anaerolineales bacterium]|nr:hypothetical protein [Anaerolineales bacterium]
MPLVLRIFISLLAMLLLLSCSSNPEATNPGDEIPVAELGAATAIQIQVPAEGMYALDLETIGWEQVPRENLVLSERGQRRPTWLTDDRQLVFYASASTSQYSQSSVFILENRLGQALEMALGIVETPGSDATSQVERTLHLEENLLYVPQVAEGDHWLWGKIIAPQSQEISFDLPGLVNGPGEVRVALLGFTQATVEPDHSVRVYLNGQLLADETWDGQTRHLVRASVANGLLQAESNQIKIEASGLTESPVDIFELDWIEIDFPVSLQAIEDAVFFAGNDQAVRLPETESTDWLLFEVTEPQHTRRLQTTTGSFLPRSGARYAVLQPAQLVPVSAARPLQMEPDLRTGASQAEYLAVGPPDLLEALEPLLTWRTNQGLSTRAIPIEAIYDQFGAGYPEPDAIQAFLKYALENWETPPRYVLLAGDTSYDFRAYQVEPGVNRLPTLMVETVYGGETGSDPLIAQVNADPWPDLAIGRIPARSRAEISTVVEKILAYEDPANQQAASRTILAVADGQEAGFEFDARKFLELFPSGYQTELLAPPAEAENTHQEIEAILETGALITAYFGHGSINMWGKDRIFTVQDSQALQNEQLPVMLNLTCLTGLYTHPSEISLAESLLFNPQGGAIAVLAPTSLTLPSDQAFLTTAFVTALTSQEQPRLGDLALYAWRQVPADYDSALDVMLTYHLFGDPALLLPPQSP